MVLISLLCAHSPLQHKHATLSKLLSDAIRHWVTFTMLIPEIDEREQRVPEIHNLWINGGRTCDIGQPIARRGQYREHIDLVRLCITIKPVIRIAARIDCSYQRPLRVI